MEERKPCFWQCVECQTIFSVRPTAKKMPCPECKHVNKVEDAKLPDDFIPEMSTI